MTPMISNKATPVPPPAYYRAHARLRPALHIDALTLVNTLHLLTLCRLAVRLARRRCPPPYLLVQGERLEPTAKSPCCSSHSCARCGDWPALALTCDLSLGKDGSPRIPSPPQQCKRGKRAGAPLTEAIFVLSVLTAIRGRLIGARDLNIDSAPILAWHRTDPDAAFGHAPAQHPRPLLRSYRVHTFICRSSGLPLFFLLSRANAHDAPFAQRLLAWAVRLYQISPCVIRLDDAYWGLRLIAWIHTVLGAVTVIPWNPKRQKNRCCLPPTWTKEELGKRSAIYSFFGRVFLFFHLQRPPLWLVHRRPAGCSHLHRYHHRRFSCSTGRASRPHPLSQTRFSSYVGGLMSWEMPSRRFCTHGLSSQ